MTDQTIPADKVKKVADWLWEDILANGGLDEEVAPQLAARTEMAEEVRRLLLALLPTPPRPTLADMSDEERAACRWMQADVYSFDHRMVITDVRTMSADLIELDGKRWNVDLERVTPRPDLPRMTWPGDTPAPAPAPATLTEGSEWGDIHALTTACRESGRDQITVIDCEGDVSVWDADEGRWAPVAPFGYEPYTILHTGKEVDQ